MGLTHLRLVGWLASSIRRDPAGRRRFAVEAARRPPDGQGGSALTTMPARGGPPSREDALTSTTRNSLPRLPIVRPVRGVWGAASPLLGEERDFGRELALHPMPDRQLRRGDRGSDRTDGPGD